MKHKYKLILAGLLLSATTTLLNAQVPLMWGVRYNAPPDMADDSRSIKVDPSGNIYVTGSGFNASGNLDVITIKYNPNGSQAWVRNYDRGIGGNDEGQELEIDAAGNVYVVGYSNGTNQGLDALVVKYDNAGTQLWASFFNGAANGLDEGRSIKVDAAGDVYIAGYTSDSSQYFDALTVKFNSAGVQQWAQIYDGTNGGNDELMDLIIDGSSNVYVTGNTESTSFNYDCLTIKYNSSGAQQWLMAFDGGNGGDFGKAITLDPNNNVIVVAQAGGVPGNWFDYLTIKYSNAGVLQWQQWYNYGSNRYEDPWAVTTDAAGYIYMTGQSQPTGSSGVPPDCATIKYTPAGNQVWVKRYDGGFSNKDDRAYAIVLDDTANVYIAGYSNNATNSDFLVVKYDSAGTEEFALRFNSVYNQIDHGRDIAVLNGDIYITGQSANLANEDFLTIRYSYSAVGVQEQMMGSNQLAAYPVPATDILTITLAENQNETSTITLVDVTGRVVLTEMAGADQAEIQLDMTGIAAGTYTVIQSTPDGNIIGRTQIVRN